MSLRKTLIESVRSKCSGSLQTKVTDLLKSPVLDTKVSPFTVATLENGAIGISYNLFHGDEKAMARCINAGFVGIMGPTAGCLTDALFELGIHAVGYSRVENPQLFLQRFERGVKWGNSTRKVWALAN